MPPAFAVSNCSSFSGVNYASFGSGALKIRSKSFNKHRVKLISIEEGPFSHELNRNQCTLQVNAVIENVFSKDRHTEVNSGSFLSLVGDEIVMDCDKNLVGESGRSSAAISSHEAKHRDPLTLLVFSGGNAFNGIVEELKQLTTKVAHVLPVSDDGGSTAEIVRVLGGPAIGDIRSRCLRLADSSSVEARAVKKLLAHRLPKDAQAAKSEWLSIMEGENDLWENVSEPYKETIRAFLVHFQHQILQHSSEKFQFQNGSVGNFFFAGARTFFRSLDSAIFLFSKISQIHPDSFVLPCIRTNDRLTLGAELQDGTVIRGQHEISHPTNSALHNPFKLKTVDKDCSTPLPSPIKKLFYLSSEGTNFMHEVFPTVNPMVLDQLRTVDAIIYGIGSLYTSVCPSLVLRDVGETIAERNCPKILLLNGTYDRETRGMSASDYVLAITNSLNRTHGEDSMNKFRKPPSSYVTILLAPRNGEIPVDVNRLNAMGITNIRMVESIACPKGGALFADKSLIEELRFVIQHY